jgi:hypothetical protein
MVKAFKRSVRSWIEIAQIGYGMWKNAKTGHTPKASHIALVSQFTRSGGRLNDRISRLISLVNRPYRVEEASSLIPLSENESFALIQEQMLRDGYYIFDNRLPEAFCDKIAADIENASFIVRDDAIEYDQDYRVNYDRSNPIAPNYMLSADETTDVHGVQELVADPTLINVAQNYLRAKSIFTGISLYWSAKNKDVPDMKAAQAFHWDMERIRWIRFFICLTDVNEDNGPHCFIKGTHKTGGMPDSITSKGYVRHTDQDVIAMFGKEAYMEFTCKKGTIIAEDSRGLHKGKMLKSGERLMLAFELSNSTFGADKRHKIMNFKSTMFEKFKNKYPKLYANFDF